MNNIEKRLFLASQAHYFLAHPFLDQSSIHITATVANATQANNLAQSIFLFPSFIKNPPNIQ